jgi:hypothetical protein
VPNGKQSIFGMKLPAITSRCAILAANAPKKPSLVMMGAPKSRNGSNFGNVDVE